MQYVPIKNFSPFYSLRGETRMLSQVRFKTGLSIRRLVLSPTLAMSTPSALPLDLYVMAVQRMMGSALLYCCLKILHFLLQDIVFETVISPRRH